jgi:hypothetical protein
VLPRSVNVALRSAHAPPRYSADAIARPTEDGRRRRPVFNGHVSRYRGCREQGSECDTGNQKLFHNAPACRSILADLTCSVKVAFG